MSDVTIKQIITAFLQTYSKDDMIPMHLIETHLPYFGEVTFSKKHSPGSYSRIFRYMRRDGDINIEFVKKEGSKEKHFKIIKKVIPLMDNFIQSVDMPQT